MNKPIEDAQMIGHKIAIVLLPVLCLMRSAVWGQENCEGVQINHTSNTPLPADYWTGRIEQDTTWRDTVYVGGDVPIALGTTLTTRSDSLSEQMEAMIKKADNRDALRIAKKVVGGRRDYFRGRFGNHSL